MSAFSRSALSYGQRPAPARSKAAVMAALPSPLEPHTITCAEVLLHHTIHCAAGPTRRCADPADAGRGAGGAAGHMGDRCRPAVRRHKRPGPNAVGRRSHHRASAERPRRTGPGLDVPVAPAGFGPSDRRSGERAVTITVRPALERTERRRLLRTALVRMAQASGASRRTRKPWRRGMTGPCQATAVSGDSHLRVLRGLVLCHSHLAVGVTVRPPHLQVYGRRNARKE